MSNYNNSSMPLALKMKIGAVIAAIVIGFMCFAGLFGSNDVNTWQVVQYPTGSVEIVDGSGSYLKWFGKVTTYPRSIQAFYSNVDNEGDNRVNESIAVTFNDGGKADISTMVLFDTPVEKELRTKLHQTYGGNIVGVKSAVRAHLANALKVTSPLMSSSEHQTARNGEFVQVVRDQLTDGLYEMRRVERELKDQFDVGGKSITVFATEIILDSAGRPKISELSPLLNFGLNIKQFSITETEYDKQTQEQFSTKKDAFLKAERSKAQREEEVQLRLMVTEKGLREKAESEALANRQKATETINAEREKVVAEMNALREKVVAETNASREVAVAEQAKKQAEILALQKLEVARLERQAAEEQAKKQVLLAEAQKKSIEMAGAISERDRVLAEISRDRDIRVAEQLSKIATPSVVINGGGADGKGADLTTQLMNLRLLESTGILTPKK